MTTAIRDGRAVTLTALPEPRDRRTALIRLAGIRDQVDDRHVQAALTRLTPALEPGCRRRDWWQRFCQAVADRDRLAATVDGWDARRRLEDAGRDSAVVDPHAEALACADDLDRDIDAMMREAGL
jgi:hypothetical protein